MSSEPKKDTSKSIPVWDEKGFKPVNLNIKTPKVRKPGSGKPNSRGNKS